VLEKIIALDKYLFLKINQDSRNAFFDVIVPFARESKTWIPLYLFLLLFASINFGKKAIWWILACVVTVSATDFISSHIIKPLIARPRPCMDIEFASQVRLLANYCGANGSFTSSHAANHFGLAMFFYITGKHISSKYSFLFFIWAAIISLSQVYVGVHYPTDIIGGAMLGMLIAWCMASFHNNKYGKL
jgi:membrane-associated phospholipid phosphatase